MKKLSGQIARFIKNNPLFSISITLGVLFLIYNQRDRIRRATKQIIEPMLKEFQNPLTNTWVTSKFGNRIDPKTNKLTTQFHNGVDLHAPSGTPVFAPADGVAALSISADGGNQLIITHKNGYKTGYAHLTSRVVHEGETVKKGQLVAYTGNSGSHTTAPHLHFTVTNKQGRKVDPLSVFDLPLKA